MYTDNSFTGDSLPHKTLCLTFDDGPGSNTLAIAEYLHQEGISATFFVVGKYAIHQPETLNRVVTLGHTIGNHTYDHPDLPYYVSVNGDIQDQIIRTDAIIQSYVVDTILFRAPYGKWSKEVAAELNANLLSTANYVGPIHWDIGGVDCYYWLKGRSVEDALDAYILDIERVGKGIVVFHDEIADMDFLKPENKTLQLLQQLIPKLKQLGYSFTGIENIAGIITASSKKLSFELSVKKDKPLSLTSIGLSSSGHIASAFTIKKVKNGQIQLMHDHHYLKLNDEKQITTTLESNEAASFDYIPVRNNRFMLRTFSGDYLVLDKDGNISATAAFMRLASVFSYKPLNLDANTKISFKERLLILKKGILFVKSKLFS
jgi:peptidoglycan/xylan/chitin deacetylase (PgdA/CDA1 family)